ncbi:hypothetical protein ACHAW5_009075 [Stephanodiscus triporus]|uniref:AAA+ ATPase domain-containing protein n=1 Tax=Stephanodiscus triporus TaxID=2934178 RepID=A0ABD3NEJ1_9STRA
MRGKNPKSEKAMSIADATQGKRKDLTNRAINGSTKLKKLRLLLQAGAPLGAVEQKAKLEGIDIALVLSPSAGKSEGGGEDDDEAFIPETLVKKYKRMIKAGVPMDRVQQLAGIETGASPEQIATIIQGIGREKAGVKEESVMNPLMSKFQLMQKAEIPLMIATQNELGKALGEEEVSDLPVPRNFIKENAVEEDNKKSTHSVVNPLSHFFAMQGGAVAFPSSCGGQFTRPLTDLILKMVQTVQKTSQFVVNAGAEVVVDELTLYHALGSLRGVKFARDEYNSTIGARGMDKELIQSKRHGFVEMATSIGKILPNDATHVDIEGLDDIIEHIENSAHSELDRGRALFKDGYYDFDSIHILYPPGSFVIAKHAGGSGVDCFCQVVWHRYTQGKTISGKPMKYFQLCCRFIVPVGGGHSTFAEVVEGIHMFEGRRACSGGELAFVPPLGHELANLLRKYNLRGEIYNRITCIDGQKTHLYMAYDRGSFYQKRGGYSFNAGKSSVALATSGRIVVDFDAAAENGHSISVGRDDMIDAIHMKLKEYKLYLCLIDDPYKVHSNSASVNSSRGNVSVTASGMILFSKIPNEYLTLVWPTTVGFSFTSKAWGDVIVDGLKFITFDPNLFERLVLPDTRKRMIKALVKHTSASGFHDLVEGKGEGTVFLLYGPPGTGKTLTAEAIAESLHRPLYSISMGTLGTTADELERRLCEILRLSARWDALVLLDEADSVLAERSSNSPIERNAMVSVMLRLVEYHCGILFLTSNRIESIDPAFQTRITLALRYESLDLEGRAQVWKNLLIKSNQDLDSLDVKALAKTELNGREVKNALRLAMALAAEESGCLSQDLLLETSSIVYGHKGAMEIGLNEEKANSGCFSSWWR